MNRKLLGAGWIWNGVELTLAPVIAETLDVVSGRKTHAAAPAGAVDAVVFFCNAPIAWHRL